MKNKIKINLRDQAEQWWEKRQQEWDTEKIARKQLLQVNKKSSVF